MRASSVMVVVLVLATLHRCGGPEKNETPPAEIPVQVLDVQTQEVVELRRLTGDVMPWEILPLSFKVGGRVDEIRVDEGDHVQEGDVLGLLDSRDYKLVAKLARVQVDALAPNLERAEDLAEKKALSQVEYDEIKSKLDAAKVQKSQAGAQLSYTRLVTPMDGVVLQKKVTEGDMVGPERPALIIAQMHRVKVVLPVAQRDLPLFEVGMNVPIRAEGVDTTFTGTVHTIGLAAESQTRTFPVTIEVENPDLELRAGMVVEATVELATHRGLFVPLDTITRDAHQKPMVLTVDPSTMTVRERPVQIGVIVGEKVEIIEGLEPSDLVVIRGLVNPGEKVLITDPRDPSS